MVAGRYIQVVFIYSLIIVKNALGGPGSGLYMQVVFICRWSLAQVRLYIESWTDKWLVKLSATKTKAVNVSSNRRKQIVYHSYSTI